MRTITTNVYKFSELSEEAKARAIENLREEMEEHEGSMALHWAIDDCSLFEPPHEDMVAIFGPDYYEENRTRDGKYGQFMLQNKRRGIIVDLDYDDLNIAQPLEITNQGMFLTWLGIPKALHDGVDFSIRDTNRGSVLDLELLDNDLPDVTELFKAAEKKFADHMEYVLEKIKTGREEYFSDYNVMDRAEGEEFLEDGTIYG